MTGIDYSMINFNEVGAYMKLTPPVRVCRHVERRE